MTKPGSEATTPTANDPGTQDFWQTRWDTSQTGFHEAKVNSFLLAHVDSLELQAGSRVLVPLCGKTVDLTFLGERATVVGVEFVERAAADYFAERGTTPSHEGAIRSAGQVSIACGDYF